jgi:NADH:ubiquinone oxidoreductase subunit 6 (subunit J)
MLLYIIIPRFLFFCFFVFLFFFIGLVRSSLLSILSLVLGFLFAAVFIFFLNAEFLSLTYVVVYVGSISMLFLFLIIMIDPRTISELFREVVTFKSFFSIFFIIFFITFFFFSVEGLYFYSSQQYSSYLFLDWSRVIYSEQNIISFSQVLFNYFQIEVVLTSICLFVGMISPLLIFMQDHD